MGTTISSPLNQPHTHPTALPLYPSKNLTLIPTCDHDLRHSPHDYAITQNNAQLLQQQAQQTQLAQCMQRNTSNRSSSNNPVEPPQYVPVPSRGSQNSGRMANLGGGMGIGGPNARYKYVGPGMYWDTWQTSAPPPAYQQRPPNNGPGGMGGDVICGFCGSSGEVGCIHTNNPQQNQMMGGGGGGGGNDILQALRGLMGMSNNSNGGGNGFMVNGGNGNGNGNAGCGQNCTANDGGIRVKGNWGTEDVNLRVGGRERCPCNEHGGCENTSHRRSRKSQNQRNSGRRRSHRHNNDDEDSDSSSCASDHRGGRGRRRSEQERERERARKEEEWRRPFRDVGERLGWTAADMEQINTGASNLNKSTAPRPPMDMGGGPGPMDGLGMGMGMGPMGPMGGGGGMNPMGMGGMNDPMGGLGGMGGMPSMSRPRRPRRPRMRPDAYGADADLGLDEGLGGLGDARGFGPPDDFEGGPGLGGLNLDDDGFGGAFGRGRRTPGGGRLGKRPKVKGLGGRPPRRNREGPDFEDYAPPEMSGALGRGANDDDAWEEVDEQSTPPSPKKSPKLKAKSPEVAAKSPARSKSPEWEDVKSPPPSRRGGGTKSRHNKSPVRSDSPDWESIKSPPPASRAVKSPPQTKSPNRPRTRPPSARPAWMDREFYPPQPSQGHYLFPPQMGYPPPRAPGYAPPFAHEVPDAENQRPPPPLSQHPGQGQHPPPPPGSVHPNAQPPPGSCPPPPPPGSYRPPPPGSNHPNANPPQPGW